LLLLLDPVVLCKLLTMMYLMLTAILLNKMLATVLESFPMKTYGSLLPLTECV